jgi:threonine dehydratase
MFPSSCSSLKNKETFLNKKVGIIISGGNVDLNNLPF